MNANEFQSASTADAIMKAALISPQRQFSCARIGDWYVFLFLHLGDVGCCGLFQVKELVDIIEAAENTIRSQVLAATTSVLFDRAGQCMTR